MITSLLRGIISLFASGFLVRPMGLLGFISGIVIMSHINVSADLLKLFSTPLLYALIALVAIVYTCLFQRTYHSGGKRVDWKNTFWSIIGNGFHLFGALAITCMFIFSFWWPDE
ncbi:MAG: hypothetical protein IJ525_04870 [Alphaproteobacteria bacterium]|nr:hypothetical protein [Alphaproteobacteria bacterium]